MEAEKTCLLIAGPTRVSGIERPVLLVRRMACDPQCGAYRTVAAKAVEVTFEDAATAEGALAAARLVLWGRARDRLGVDVEADYDELTRRALEDLPPPDEESRGDIPGMPTVGLYGDEVRVGFVAPVAARLTGFGTSYLALSEKQAQQLHKELAWALGELARRSPVSGT